MQLHNQRPHKQQHQLILNLPVETLVLVAIVIIYGILRFLLEQPLAAQFAVAYPDTADYLHVASLSLLDKDFWLGMRAFTLPLIYKILRVKNHPHTACYFQMFSSMACWGFLTIQIVKKVKPLGLKVLAMVLILTFSMSKNIVIWDTNLLSESLALSFMALMIGSWLWLMEEWRWWKVVSLLTVSLLWGFCRDSNAWVLFFLALTLGALLIFKLIPRRFGIIAGFLFLFFIGSYISADIGYRSRSTGQDIISFRILTNDENRDYFVRHGMPVTPELLKMAADIRELKYVAEDYDNPNLESFEDWIRTQWNRVYIRWLITHPRQYFEPLRQEIFTFDSGQEPWMQEQYVPILPPWIEKFIYPSNFFFCAFALLLAGTAGMLTMKLWKKNIYFLVPLTMILLLYPHAAIIWHGEPDEVGRHALQLSIQFYLALHLSLIFLINHVHQAMNHKRQK